MDYEAYGRRFTVRGPTHMFHPDVFPVIAEHFANCGLPFGDTLDVDFDAHNQVTSLPPSMKRARLGLAPGEGGEGEGEGDGGIRVEDPNEDIDAELINFDKEMEADLAFLGL